jgi:hypothetical protein
MSRVVVSESSLVSVAHHLVSAGTEDDTVILDAIGSRYYGLSDVGARVWELIQQPRPASEILATLVAEYDVERQVAWGDLRDLLEELAAAGLVDVADGRPR